MTSDLCIATYRNISRRHSVIISVFRELESHHKKMASNDAPKSVSSGRLKHLPGDLSELLNVAIFSFGSLSGLRASHKVRGDPVVDGVCAMFASLLQCADNTTKANLEKAKDRLGGWTPGEEPTKELQTWASSRLNLAKNRGTIKSRDDPDIPGLLLEKRESWNECLQRVESVYRPRCWRCHRVCRFCRLRRRKPTVASLRAE